MLKLTHLSLATVDELFRYKQKKFTLPPFPGYTDDQWGIKAHNRPWIEEVGDFKQGLKIIEVGGAYSTLPKYLANKFNLEAWIGDDFGGSVENNLWKRWGDPINLKKSNPEVNYIFENFGNFSEHFPTEYFDRIFSVSTLEHIPFKLRLDVFKDINRCLKVGGMQMHTIDISTGPLLHIIRQGFIKKYPVFKLFFRNTILEIEQWIDIIRKSGIEVNIKSPNPLKLLDRRYLVESPDVVYRFYPPNDEPTNYNPSASLLLIIKKN